MNTPVKRKQSVESAATHACYQSRSCAKCQIYEQCFRDGTGNIRRACAKSFIEGFRKGAEWKRKQMRQNLYGTI